MNKRQEELPLDEVVVSFKYVFEVMFRSRADRVVLTLM